MITWNYGLFKGPTDKWVSELLFNVLSTNFQWYKHVGTKSAPTKRVDSPVKGNIAREKKTEI